MNNYKIEVREEAQLELQEAFDWYEIQQEGLGRRFILKVREYINHLNDFPEQYSFVHKNKRAVFINYFPYQIIYAVVKDTVVIYSVFHTKRNPKSWKKRK